MKCPKCKSDNIIQLGVRIDGHSDLICLDCDWNNMNKLPEKPRKLDRLTFIISPIGVVNFESTISESNRINVHAGYEYRCGRCHENMIRFPVIPCVSRCPACNVWYRVDRTEDGNIRVKELQDLPRTVCSRSIT